MSSVNKAPTTSKSNDISSSTDEESGWTSYLEDSFSNENNDDDNNYKCSVSLSAVASSSSLVSDATSLVDKKVAHSQHTVEEDVYVNNKNGAESCFEKRENIIDDALEDTATSPLNRPEEKGNTSGQKDEQKELNFNGKNSDCTDLAKLTGEASA